MSRFEWEEGDLRRVDPPKRSSFTFDLGGKPFKVLASNVTEAREKAFLATGKVLDQWKD